MKKERLMIIVIGLLAVFLFVNSAHTLLEDNLDGTVTQTRNDGSVLMWLQDANYAKTSGYNTTQNGRMWWTEAMTWIDYLNSNNHLGYNDWRLPHTLPINGTSYDYNHSYDGSTDYGYNITSPNSEMAYMYYVELENMGYFDTSGNVQYGSLINTRPFNIEASMYWSGTENVLDTTQAWEFSLQHGGQNYVAPKDFQYYVWAVRDVQPIEIDNDSDGYTENQGDCNDTESTVHPNAMEIENDGIDQNCDGYEIVDLGTFGGDSRAIDINNNGQIVGYSHISPNEYHAFIYENGIMTDIGTLGGIQSLALGINDIGQVVGWSGVKYSQPDSYRGFLYKNNTMSDIGTLGGNNSEGVDINNSGQIVGYSNINTNSNDIRAFLHDDNGMTDLGTLGGNDYSIAHKVNDFGQIVGEAKNTNNDIRAFLYENGIMNDLGTLGGNNSFGWGINNHNQVVGISQTDDGSHHAFLYDSGIMIDLGSLDPDSDYSFALGINDYGQIIGESKISSNYHHAFLYDNGLMIDLGTLGGNNSEAKSINNLGQIVGWAEDSSGLKHSVLWTPMFSDPEDIDDDGDGYTENEGDCDDTEPKVNPSTTEICNSIDDNCVNGIDEGFNVGETCDSSPNSCGDINAGRFVCTTDGSGTECDAVQPAERAGYGDSCVSDPNNCGDTNTGVYICADVGVECTAVAPNDRPLATGYIDADSDGYGNIHNPVDAKCGLPSGAVDNSLDCNDNDSSINPGATEIKHDSIDQNCNGYDLTIDIIKADYNIHNNTFKVEATSDLGQNANLTLIGFNLMTWYENKGKWMITIIDAGELPAIVTVCGIEGCDSVPLTGCCSSARVVGASTQYYSSIQSAYNAAVDGDTVQIQEGFHNENVNINASKTVAFENGYGCVYASITGETTVNGNLTMREGVLVINNGQLILGMP